MMITGATYPLRNEWLPMATERQPGNGEVTDRQRLEMCRARDAASAPRMGQERGATAQLWQLSCSVSGISTFGRETLEGNAATALIRPVASQMAAPMGFRDKKPAFGPFFVRFLFFFVPKCAVLCLFTIGGRP